MEEVQGCSNNNGNNKNKEIRVWCDGCYDMVSVSSSYVMMINCYLY